MSLISSLNSLSLAVAAAQPVACIDIESAAKNAYQKLESLPKLEGGMSSSNLHVFEHNGIKYVIKNLSRRTQERFQIEILGHRIGEKLGIAPPLTYVDEKQQFFISPLIEGHILTKDDLSEENLTTLAQMMRKLNDYRGDFTVHRSQLTRAEAHFKGVVAKKITMPERLSDYYEAYMKEGEQLVKNGLVVSHGDLHPGNILKANDGKLYFIDWANATLDSSYTDIGLFAYLNKLTLEQSCHFLKAYLEREPSKQELQSFDQSQQRTALYTAIAWLNYSKPQEENDIYRKNALNDFKNYEEWKPYNGAAANH